MEQFLARVDDWFARGAEIALGLPTQHSAKILLPNKVDKIFEDAHAVFFSEFHYNYS